MNSSRSTDRPSAGGVAHRLATSSDVSAYGCVAWVRVSVPRGLACLGGASSHGWRDFVSKRSVARARGTDRLSCRLGFREAVAELLHLWGVAPEASTAKRWIGRDGDRAKAVVKADAEANWKRYEN